MLCRSHGKRHYEAMNKEIMLIVLGIDFAPIFPQDMFLEVAVHIFLDFLLGKEWGGKLGIFLFTFTKMENAFLAQLPLFNLL